MSRWRKAMCMFFAVVLVCMAGIGTNAAKAATDYTFIRVCLKSMGDVQEVSFTVQGTYYVGGGISSVIPKGTDCTIKNNKGKLMFNYNGISVDMGTKIYMIQCDDPTPVNYLVVKNPGYGTRNYLGDMQFDLYGGVVRLINRVPLEEYLLGVVPFEMSESWHMEALKAQAIAARTYAASKIGSSGDYDIVDTTANQVYKGYVASYVNTQKAVQDTRGMVLYWGGKFSDGVYSASNGGQTMSRVPVWGTVNYYHEMKEDPYDLANPSSPSYTVYFPVENGKDYTFDNRLLGLVKPLVVNELKAKKVDFTEDSVNLVGATKVEPFELKEGYDSVSLQFQKVRVTFRVETKTSASKATVQEVRVEFTTAQLKTAFSGATNTLSSARLLYVDKTEDGKAIALTLRGYGHGIGMSQRGVQTMAKQGMNYKQMIDFYYNGCIIEKLSLQSVVLPAPPNAGPKQYALVKANLLNVRAGKGTSYKVLGVLKENEQVTVFTTGDWVRVENKSGLVGYVSTVYLSYIPIDSTNKGGFVRTTGTVLPDKLKVMSVPKGTKEVATLSKGNKVTVLDKNGSWYLVAYPVEQGWVPMSQLKLDPAPKPTATPAPTPTATDSGDATPIPTETPVVLPSDLIWK